MHGFLAANKPSGVSSARYLARVKSTFPKQTKAGHSGTLDPLASGLLVVAIGWATRYIGYLPLGKRYDVEVTFGIETDTLDAEGEVVSRSTLPPGLPGLVEKALPRFIGLIDQRAPNYSALKHEGVPMYSLMRSGKGPVPVKVRKVQVDSIESIGWLDDRRLRLRVECGPGVYMRSLAHDLGKEAGCGAFMSGLTREACGGFVLGDALSIGEDKGVDESCHGALRPINETLSHLRAVRLDDRQASKVTTGQQAELAETEEGFVRILVGSDRFLGVGEVDGTMLLPRRMLPSKAHGIS